MRLRIVLPGANNPLPKFVAVSVLGHVLLAVLFSGVIRFGSSRTEFQPSMQVELFGADVLQPAPGPATSAPAVEDEPEAVEEIPEPEPEPPQEEVTAAPEPDPLLPPKPKPEEEEEQKPRKKPPVKKPATTPPKEASPTESGGGGGSDSSAGEGATQVSGQGLGVEYNWYNQRVMSSLHQSWKKPLLTGLTDSIACVIGFEILKDGSVRNVRLVEESGVRSLDRSALRAAAEAILPPLPSALREPSRNFQVQFVLHPDDS